MGRRKVDMAAKWANGYSSRTRIEPFHEQVNEVSRLRQLAEGCDVVVCAIDTPPEVQLLVNEACFDAGVPFVTGGLQQSTVFYWSVEPGRSPCRNRLGLHRNAGLDDDPAFRRPPLITADRGNRATGPVVQLLSGLISLEAMRYVTHYDPPVAAATYHWIGLADGMRTEREPWTWHPDCPLCSRSPVPSGSTP